MVLCHAVSDCMSSSAVLASSDFVLVCFFERHWKLDMAQKWRESVLLCRIWLFWLQTVSGGEEGCRKGNIKSHQTVLVSFCTACLLIFHISVHLMLMRDGAAKLVSVTIGNLTGVMCLVWVIVEMLTRPAFKGRENKRAKSQNLSACTLNSY